MSIADVDGRVIVRGRYDAQHVRQSALAAVVETYEAVQSESNKGELDMEVRGG